ncbi:MAG: DUF4142 domain-containing protein [Bacteroidota bacterium]|nr:DUF4142 domain-containing protein [Bacteroidota bacterium]MDP4234198.1 DUF4142 domain-containing protein [Bacteroidota bacterium]MDP4243736.1 DUF4142 domain-containing protein [Bacteroidota bacterium]MDP4287899.1 DUF4142 domain-containing protein [Bacteroidota bacterium]
MMKHSFLSKYIFLGEAFLLSLALIAASCTRKTNTDYGLDSITSSAISPGPNPSSSQPANTSMSDENIIAALCAADSAEITEAKYVISHTKNTEVRSFANMMVVDHSKMWKEKKELAKKLNVKPLPPANDNGSSMMASEMDALRNAPNAHAMDSLYIADAIQDHKEDLKDVKELQTTAHHAELRDAIKGAEPVVMKHLEHPRAIESKLMSGAGMAASKRSQ